MQLERKYSVSTLMSVYNETVLELTEAIESIINQTRKPDEIIIILDNPDRSDLIKVLKMYENDYEMIHVFINEYNKGIVDSVNRGIDYCTGEYIMRMDADDISMPNRIEREMALLLLHNADFITSRVEYFKNNDKGLGYSKKVSNIRKRLEYRNDLLHPTWIAKSELFRNLYYRQIPYAEDFDFICRAILSDYKIIFTDEILVRVRIRESSISHSNWFRQMRVGYVISQSLRRGDTFDLGFDTIQKAVESSSFLEPFISSFKNRSVMSKLYKFLTAYGRKILILQLSYMIRGY